MGRDVIADRLASDAQDEREQRNANTFGAAARLLHRAARAGEDEDLGAHRAAPRPSPATTSSRSRRDSPTAGRDRPVAEITAHDIHSLIDEVRTRGVPGLARRRKGKSEFVAWVTLARVGRLFSWLVERRVIEKNPCIGVHRPDTSTARDRVLDDPELHWFWLACDALG